MITWAAVACLACPGVALAGVVGNGNNGGGNLQGTLPQGVTAKFYAKIQNPSQELASAELTVQIPYQPLSKGGGGTAGCHPVTATWCQGGGGGGAPAPDGTSCSFPYQAQAAMSEASDAGTGNGNQKRVLTWMPPDKRWVNRFDPSKPFPAFFLLSPTAKGSNTGTNDGTMLVPANGYGDGTASGGESSYHAAQVIAAHNIYIPYFVRAHIQTGICEIDGWAYADTRQMPIAQVVNTTGNVCPDGKLAFTCVVPVIQAAERPPGLCTANCAQPIQNVFTPAQMDDKLKSVLHDGGQINLGGIDPTKVLVQTAVPMGIGGGPAAQKDVYLAVTQEVGAGSSITAVTYEVHLAYVGSDFTLVDDDAKTSSVVCSNVITCNYTFDLASHYHLKVVDHFSVEYRFVYVFDYQTGGVVAQDWTPYPGAGARRDLCAAPATSAAPDCGPGLQMTVGQYEAIPAG
ncbi:MAG: hypothetical protein ACYDGR_09875 [Candidatus Dormibacteria bacterium]